MKWIGAVGVGLLCLLGCEAKRDIHGTARELNPEMKSALPADSTIDEAELGVDVYPEAKTPKGMPPMIRSGVSDVATSTHVATVEVWLESTGSIAEIASFYRSRLGGAKSETAPSSETVSGLNRKGEKTVVICRRKTGANVTTISILVTKNVLP